MLNIIKSLRPWGNFVQYCQNEKVTVKIITVEPGESLSIQLHQKRDELWVALSEQVTAIIDHEKFYKLENGQELFIPRGTVHVALNTGDKPTSFLEISFGDFDENDIKRLSDKYGRV